MYDQSFSAPSIARMLRSSDFAGQSIASNTAFKEAAVRSAVQAAHSLFQRGLSLIHLRVGARDVYQLRSIPDQLVIRKLSANIQRFVRARHFPRNPIITNVVNLLSEGVPYRVYRLDIKQFYSSFRTQDVLDHVRENTSLSPHSRDLLSRLFELYTAAGGKGLPTGLGISATLADFMMSEFDDHFRHNTRVHFYARYVDDLLLVTGGTEDKKGFVSEVRSMLPKGLSLNPAKVAIRDSPSARPLTMSFDFLGYNFSVSDPPHNVNFRNVKVDIAQRKVKKLQTRMCRAFLSFARDRDFQLLEHRVQFLTSNYEVLNRNTGIRKLAGIYESFPQIQCTPPGALGELDRFLSGFILGTKGRIPKMTCSLLTRSQKRILMSHSFARGHSERVFHTFTFRRLGEIKRCWRYGV